jgi:hypothetical protein
MSSNSAPSVVAMTGGNKSLVGPLFRAMIRACQLAGRVYIATVIDTGSIAGLALWFPPGKVLWQKSVAITAGYVYNFVHTVTSDAQRNLGFNQFLESLSPKTREWWINTVSSTYSYLFLSFMSIKVWFCTGPFYHNGAVSTCVSNPILQNFL